VCRRDARLALRHDQGAAVIFDFCTELKQKLQSIPEPVIPEVQGIATAAGCQLVATCDLAIAAEDAAFATPGVKIGLFRTTPMVALTCAIGRKRAMQMRLTGESAPARATAEWGLVNQAVPAAELQAATSSLAEKVAAASSLSGYNMSHGTTDGSRIRARSPAPASTAVP
jgi:enoyl-CoA hydratase/carnithine racemase